MSEIQEILQASNSWAAQCAKKLLKRIGNKPPSKGYVLFETGYGPSGLPHIGTFGEVVRTKFVQHVFEKMTDFKTKLFVVSDDYDGLRKIPDNMPNKEMLKENLQRPLTSIPDPFGTHASFGENMNSRLRSFLDSFNFEYEFKSATDLYKAGVYDRFLLKALEKFDDIMKVMIPTLGDERQQTYSPFLPICPRTGRILYVATKARNIDAGTITYEDPETGKDVEIKVTGGHCKLQWKPDFGLRWAALDVDFEMYGKDHLANGPIYSRICNIVGGRAPEQFVFELFLDRNGQKISKSKGNEEITVDKWLKYAPTESLSLFMYQNPQRAKKLYFDVVPKSVDEYITFVQNYHQETDLAKKCDNPVWYIHNGNVPTIQTYGLSFSLLLNLAAASNPSDKTVLWKFIQQYAKNIDVNKPPFLDKLLEYAVNYYNDLIKDNKNYRIPNGEEIRLLKLLKEKLVNLSPHEQNSELIQSLFYEIGRNSSYENMRDFFQMVYEVLLGQSQGPRLGSFVALYGVDKTIKLIEQSVNQLED